MTYNGINNIPRDGLVGEFLLDGNGDDTSGNGNNGTCTDITRVGADKGYVKECGQGSNGDANMTYNSITYSNSYIWIDGVLTKNSTAVTDTKLTLDDGKNYGLLRFYNRDLTANEEFNLQLEGLRKLGPGIMQQYPELFKGCVGYWDFREGNLSNLIDGTNATNNGATLTTDHLGYANNAMYFGTGDTRINTVCNVNPIFTHTIICKVVNDSGDNDQVLIECYNGSNYNNRSFISLNRNSSGDYLAGSIAFYGNDGSTNANLSPDTDLGINDGNWHIVSWTRDSANTNKMYLDGTEITGLNGSIQSGDITSSFAKQTHFGRYYSQTAAGLDGSISAIIINNRALSSSEISQLYNLLMEKYIYPNPRYTPQSLPKPVLYINGNHSGDTYYDISGNGNNGTQSGGVGGGKIGQSKYMSFDGTDDKITVSASGTSVVNYDEDYSWGGWGLTFDTANSNHILITGQGTRDNQIYMGQDIKFLIYDGSYNEVSFTGINANQRYHVIGTRSKTDGMKLYVNGVLVDSNTFTGNANSKSTNDRLGCYGDTDSDWFNGEMTNIRVWDTVLSDKQIQELYYAEKGNFIN